MTITASFLSECICARLRVASQKGIPSIGTVLPPPYKDAYQNEQGRCASDNPDHEVVPNIHVPSC
ncbi:MAG: hypothetical protein WCB14_14880, partial [Candidatus Acidiferrales bacterium]